VLASNPDIAARRWWRRRPFIWARRVVVGFLIFMVAGNAAIIVPSLVLQQFAGQPTPASAADVRDVDNLAAVDAKVWRGAAPTTLAGYQSLAAAGVSTIVDLRAGAQPGVDVETLRSYGLTVVPLPITDGQTPTPSQIADFRRVVGESKGTVFVHCGAGVGRTGSMAAAYLVATGQASGIRATWRNLSVGPPSLEQIAFSVRLAGDRAEHANVAVVAVSRVLDAPRRIWTVLG
jgi:protein tyrosine phosphatase (PTP) superfamily phosphohydrolase (DUF442 family)